VNDIIDVAKEIALMTGVVYELEKHNKPAATTDGASTSGGRKSRRRKYIKRKKTNRRK